MRKLLAILALLATLGLTTSAHAGWRSPECRFGTLVGGPNLNREEVKRTIWCANRKWTVPGGIRMALCIANRESGFNERAANPTSSASGVFQFVDGTWDSLRNHSLAPFAARYDLSRSVWNGRANSMIGVMAMHRYGLSPWGGGC